MWWRIGIGVLLLGHAFVHGVWRTYGPKSSWLLPGLAEPSTRSLCTALFVASAVGFAVAGALLFFNHGWWKPIAVVSSVVSLTLLILFWNRGLVVGAAIDAAILTTLLWSHSPWTVFAES